MFCGRGRIGVVVIADVYYLLFEGTHEPSWFIAEHIMICQLFIYPWTYLYQIN